MPEFTLYCGDLCRQSTAGTGGTKCGLCPLARVYNATAQNLPAVWEIDADEIPQPQRQLLMHQRDMTTTLETFHGARTHLRLLRVETESEIYQREVVLALDGSERPVAFGASSIHLALLPVDAQREIVLAQRPLGGLLLEHGHKFVSRPKAFIRVEADTMIRRALELDGHGALYGRCNALLTPQGDVFADIVEILPL
jgi:chorismate-pyruvate lyase